MSAETSDDDSSRRNRGDRDARQLQLQQERLQELQSTLEILRASFDKEQSHRISLETRLREKDRIENELKIKLEQEEKLLRDEQSVRFSLESALKGKERKELELQAIIEQEYAELQQERNFRLAADSAIKVLEKSEKSLQHQIKQLQSKIKRSDTVSDDETRQDLNQRLEAAEAEVVALEKKERELIQTIQKLQLDLESEISEHSSDRLVLEDAEKREILMKSAMAEMNEKIRTMKVRERLRIHVVIMLLYVCNMTCDVCSYDELNH